MIAFTPLMPAAEKNDKYVSLAQAVHLSGVSRGTILRWLKDRESGIRVEHGAGGSRTYFLADVLERAGIEEDEVDDSGEEEKLSAHLVRALGQSHKHVENLLEPSRKVTETLSEENKALRIRIGELEAKLFDMLKEQEDQMRARHELELAEARELREQARMDELLKTFMGYAPAALMGLATHLGMAPVQEAVLADSVATLSDEHFAALVKSGILSPQALLVIERARAAKKQNGNGQQTQTPH